MEFLLQVYKYFFSPGALRSCRDPKLNSIFTQAADRVHATVSESCGKGWLYEYI